ncbi:MAG: hypothetical protein ACYCS1_10380, partial [Gammaproteobacteria bacterium]
TRWCPTSGTGSRKPRSIEPPPCPEAASLHIENCWTQVITLELWLPGQPFSSSVGFSSDSRIDAVWTRKQGRRSSYLIQVAEHEKTWIDLSIQADRIAYAGGDLRKLGFVLMDAAVLQGYLGHLRKLKFWIRLSLDRMKRLCGWAS